MADDPQDDQNTPSIDAFLTSLVDELLAQIDERPPNATGRPGLLTRAMATRVIDGIRHGHYYVTACQLAGVTYHTFQQWMTKGDAEDETPENRTYVIFRKCVHAAEAEWLDSAIRSVRAAGEKDWKATAALMGRRHRGLWSEQPAGGESGKSHVTINVGIALPGVTNTTQVLEAQIDRVPELSLPQGDIASIIGLTPTLSPGGDDPA